MALIVTIIVLLILSAVSLSAVFNQDGIFSRTEQATDNESGVKELRYTISPTTIIPSSGVLTSGTPIELTATEFGEYTVTFIAENNSGKKSESITAKTLVDTMSVSDAKK